MSFSVRCVPAIVFTILSLAVNVCAQTTTSQTTKTPRGSISGRVTIKDKGAAGVAIGVRKDAMDPFEQYSKVVTDHDGFYRISNLRAGAYEVFASAPAFVVAENNNQRNKAVIVADGEDVDNINFSLVRGGVITGKVTDADGRPLIMQQVHLFPADAPEPQQGRPPLRLFMPNAVITDDRGVYRMYGLAAGRYKVASGRGDDAFMGSFVLNRTTYKQVFHPDVIEYPKAKVIEVSEGSEIANVDITLGRAQTTFTASGRVIDSEKNAPVPNLRLGVQRVVAGQRVEMVPTLSSTNAQGDFILEGLIPGKYAVYLFQMASQSQAMDMRAEQSNFDIVDQDVSGITVRLTRGAALSGIVVLESEDKTAWKKLQEMQLRAFVLMRPGEGGFGQSSVSTIGPDGTFRLGGLAPGTVNIFLNAAMGNPMATKGFMISRIERDGVALPQRMEVKDGEQISGLRLVIAYGNATLRGVVRIENGTLPPEGRISARLSRPGESTGMSMMPPPQVDARGHFILEGLPAGTYELIVSVNMGIPGQVRTVKQTVTLQDGIINDVVVTIDLGATPK